MPVRKLRVSCLEIILAILVLAWMYTFMVPLAIENRARREAAYLLYQPISYCLLATIITMLLALSILQFVCFRRRTAFRQRTEKSIEKLYMSGVFRGPGRNKAFTFCCACFRLAASQLPPEAQHTIEVAEQYQAELVSKEEMAAQRARLSQLLNTDPTCSSYDILHRRRKLTAVGEVVQALKSCLTEFPDEPTDETVLLAISSPRKVIYGSEVSTFQLLVSYFGGVIIEA